MAGSGPFPELVLSRCAEDVTPSCLSTSEVDVIVFTIFSDWGLEPAQGNLHKYYLAKPAAKAGVDISDITLTGGSRSAFYGSVPVSKFDGLRDVVAHCGLTFRSGTNLLRSEDGLCNSDVASSSRTGTVAYGLGLVTQEAWRHPEVRGRGERGGLQPS